MDKRADGLRNGAEGGSLEPDPSVLEARVEATRRHLDEVVREIDRRRHRAATPAALVLGLAAIAGGAVVWAVRRRRRTHPLARFGRALMRAWNV